MSRVLPTGTIAVVSGNWAEDEARGVLAGLNEFFFAHSWFDGAETFERLVTVTGSAGVGKTRLALRVAGEVMDTFHDGVVLIKHAQFS